MALDGNRQDTESLVIPAKAYRFNPWAPVDADWGGLRLLIVGESHYDEGIKYSPAEQWEHTHYVVRRYGAEARETTTFFLRIAQTFIQGASTIPDDDYRAFWKRVCFCNYVQEFVPDKPGKNKVSKEMIRRSGPAFHELLDDVRPNAVLVMSAAIWEDMSAENVALETDDVGGIGRVYRYTYRDGTCLAAHTDHPRARFKNIYRPDVWRPRVQAFLDYARAALASRESV